MRFREMPELTGVRPRIGSCRNARRTSIVRRMLSRVFVIVGTASALAYAFVMVAACEVGGLDLGSNCAPGTPDECCPCPAPEACPDGSPPLPAHCLSDGGADATGDGSQANLCPGSCVPAAPPTWDGPMHVAVDAAIALPSCPALAPTTFFEGYAAPASWSLVCPECSCDAPLGSCELPATWTVSSTACADLSPAVKTPFNPPLGWDGSCTATGAIPEGKLCGGVPCVNSIWVSVPVIHEAPCVPHGDEAMPPPPRIAANDAFDLAARACTNQTPWPSCPNSTSACMPAFEGFHVCISHSGDEPCPAGWDDRHVFHEQVDDERTCAPCSCSAPTGGICEARYRVFDDGACGSELVAVKLTSGMQDKCADFNMPGVALGSKSAELLSYQAGVCEPNGGAPVGDVLLSEPVTFCCLNNSA